MAVENLCEGEVQERGQGNGGIEDVAEEGRKHTIRRKLRDNRVKDGRQVWLGWGEMTERAMRENPLILLAPSSPTSLEG